MTLLSESGESNKTNAKEVSYEALYEVPLTRKTRLYNSCWQKIDFEKGVLKQQNIINILKSVDILRKVGNFRRLCSTYASCKLFEYTYRY